MKKVCKNCRWCYIDKKKWWGGYKTFLCCHPDIQEKIKGEHISSGEKIEYTKTNRLIEDNYIVAQTTPPWCLGFEEIPQKMPKEMADKIFRSDEDEDN